MLGFPDILLKNERSIKPGSNNSYTCFIVTVMVMVLALFAYQSGFSKQSRNKEVFTQNSREIPFLPAQKSANDPIGSTPDQTDGKNRPESVNANLILELNSKAIDHINRREYWQAIYYLEKAIKLEPADLSSVMNLAVSFSELGLYKVALLYFKEAYEVDPNHPVLKENLRILRNAGLLDGTLNQVLDYDHLNSDKN